MKLNLKYYSKGDFKLEDIKFELNSGEILTVIGDTGSGKTSLVKSIIGANKFDGELFFKNIDLSKLSNLQKVQHIAYMCQDMSENNSTIYEECMNVRIPFMKWKETNEDIYAVEHILNILDLNKLKHRSISTLSKGERKKVNIARTLCQEASIYVVDDLLCDLDLKTSTNVLEFIRKKINKENSIMIAVVNDINFAKNLGDKYLLLKNGKQLAFGCSEVFNKDNLQRVYDTQIDLI
ncbi:ATP-binding cassette domain-containing protein [Cetobacterium sp. SF1]|uniref:ATP-binding cassette domain-containing protein n=1 Tax=unclassified Cetobacterium TaxID=2630983 RepID=UPI003CF4E4A5